MKYHYRFLVPASIEQVAEFHVIAPAWPPSPRRLSWSRCSTPRLFWPMAMRWTSSCGWPAARSLGGAFEGGLTERFYRPPGTRPVCGVGPPAHYTRLRTTRPLRWWMKLPFDPAPILLGGWSVLACGLACRSSLPFGRGKPKGCSNETRHRDRGWHRWEPTTAAVLARAGMDVTVLEAQVYPGSCASTYFHQGYRFDSGATFAAGFYPGGPMDRVAQAAGIDAWPARPVETAMLVHLPDGMNVSRRTGDHHWDDIHSAFSQPGLDFFRWQERTADARWSRRCVCSLASPISRRLEQSNLHGYPRMFQRRAAFRPELRHIPWRDDPARVRRLERGPHRLPGG